MSEKNGGCAFPVSGYIGQYGMTLRDWFAGQALVGVMVDGELGANSAAELCYRFADAMLKERDK
jgi:hypothetical protein